MVVMTKEIVNHLDETYVKPLVEKLEGLIDANLLNHANEISIRFDLDELIGQTDVLKVRVIDALVVMYTQAGWEVDNREALNNKGYLLFTNQDVRRKK